MRRPAGGAKARLRAFRRFFLPDTRYRHFHFVYLFRFVQKYLPVLLLPLLRALLEWDLAALWLALRQSGALLAAAALLALLEWRAAGWMVDGSGVLHLCSGLVRRRHLLLRREELAAVRIERAPHCRLLGAAAVALYPARAQKPAPPVLYLPRADAERLAAMLIPAEGAPFYRAVGAERLPMVLLGADTVTTGVLLWAAVRRTHQLGIRAEQAALAGFSRAAAAAAAWLPAGTAWLLTGAGVLLLLSLGRSLCRTAFYKVYKSDACILFRGGIFHLSACRVRIAAVTVCDIRATPAARLLRHYPVYLTAGTYRGDLPVLLLHAGQESRLAQLIPGAVPAPARRQDTAGRSFAAFLLLPGLGCGMLSLLALAALFLLPGLAGAFALAALVCGGMLAAGIRGRRCEDVTHSGACLTAHIVRRFTLHTYCLPAAPAQTVLVQSVWAYAARRGNLLLCLAGGTVLKVKSIPEAQAAALGQFKKYA